MVSIWLPTFAAVVIAINTRILSGDNAAAKLLTDYFISIAASNTAHQFYFISNNEKLPASFLSNVKYIAIKQQSANPLFWKLWYNYKLPAALKKIKADVLVSADGIGSLRTKLPQCVCVNGLAFLLHPEWYSKNYVRFINANMPASFQKAKQIFAFSNVVKNEIAKQFKVGEEKIITASFFINKTATPLSSEENEAVKQKFADGNEYFLFYGAIHSRSNLTNLLKAFSLFKKRQKSTMQLVLVTDSIPAKNAFVESLLLYKYRDDVKMYEINNDKEIARLVAAAWCCISLSPWHSDIIFLQNALQCQVPVIAGNSSQAKELLDGAALYSNPDIIESIAEKMMLVYKDEALSNQLVSEGKRLLAANNKTKLHEYLWQHIVSITQK